MKFNNLPLSQPLLKMLQQRNLENATEVQEQAIPIILKGQDIIGLSQTGTGKTLAFVLPILEQIDANNDNVQAVILCPTRELAQQTRQEVQISSSLLPYVRSVAIYGGSDIRQQIFALKRKPNVIIGTPGRILDHLKRHTLKLNNVRTLVLDEADEMLNMGFRNDIIDIIKKTPTDRQTLLFSATMNDEVLKIGKEHMNNAVQIKVGQQNSTINNIKQTYFLVPKDKKKKALHSLLNELERGKTLIFCNTKTMVGGVQSYLEKMGYPVSVLHGDMPQSQRSKVMRDYKGEQVQILITTDVSARGIDVNDILHVINFDLPQNLEYYIHRIGRTGRAGKEGNAWTILNSPDQERKLKEIQKRTNSTIKLEKLQLSNIEETASNKYKSDKDSESNLQFNQEELTQAKSSRTNYQGQRRTYSRNSSATSSFKNSRSNSDSLKSRGSTAQNKFKHSSTTKSRTNSFKDKPLSTGYSKNRASTEHSSQDFSATHKKISPFKKDGSNTHSFKNRVSENRIKDDNTKSSAKRGGAYFDKDAKSSKRTNQNKSSNYSKTYNEKTSKSNKSYSKGKKKILF